MTTALNAANEIAVEAFLDGKIRLSDVPQIIENVMNEHESQPATSLEIILETDAWARKQAIMNLGKTASAN
jgi:1-deoxy-D-xylulose-5-phosphate reductoisomerase